MKINLHTFALFFAPGFRLGRLSIFTTHRYQPVRFDSSRVWQEWHGADRHLPYRMRLALFHVLVLAGGGNVDHVVGASIFDITEEMQYLGTLLTGGRYVFPATWLELEVNQENAP